MGLKYLAKRYRIDDVKNISEIFDDWKYFPDQDMERGSQRGWFK